MAQSYESTIEVPQNMYQDMVQHYQLPSAPSLSVSVPVPQQSNEKKHIARPPNAFLLFRSELIRLGKIPPNVEHRQQKLSSIAGQCWNLLPPHEKAVYHERAKVALEEHKRKFPDYKFSPAPRGSKRARAKAQEIEAGTSEEDRIKHIRETYTGIQGPATVAPRRRNRKPKQHQAPEQGTQPQQPADGPSQYSSPLSPSMAMDANFATFTQQVPTSAGTNMSAMDVPPYVHQPLPLPFGYPIEPISRPVTPGYPQDSYGNPPVYDYSSPDSFASSLYSTPSVLPHDELPQDLDFNAPEPALAQYSNVAEYNNISGTVPDSFESGLNLNFDYQQYTLPDTLAGFNPYYYQQPQAFDESATIARMADSALPFGGAPAQWVWDGESITMTTEEPASLHSVPASPVPQNLEYPMDGPSPAVSVGSSQF